MRFLKCTFPLGTEASSSAMKTSPLHYFSWLDREAEQEAVEYLGCALSGLGGFRRVGDQQRGFLQSGDKHVCQFAYRLILDDALRDRFADHLIDEGDAVGLFDRAQCLPAQHYRTIEEHDPLDLRFERRLEKAVQASREFFPRIIPGGRGGKRPQCQVLLYLFEHGAKQLRLVLEVVIEGAARAHPGPGDQIADAGVEVALVDEQLPPGVDKISAGRLATRAAFVVGPAAFGHGDDRSNIQHVCCRWADEIHEAMYPCTSARYRAAASTRVRCVT